MCAVNIENRKRVKKVKQGNWVWNVEKAAKYLRKESEDNEHGGRIKWQSAKQVNLRKEKKRDRGGEEEEEEVETNEKEEQTD